MTASPTFLSRERVQQLHGIGLALGGGAQGLRDKGLLESALAQPRAMYGGNFLHHDLAAMAAAYLFHLVCNHAFIDGNKRVAALAAVVFLDLNGTDLTAGEDDYEAVVRSVASSAMGKAEVADFIRQHSSTR